MSSDKRQRRLIKPSRAAAREAWLNAREVVRQCAELVSECTTRLKAAKEALALARDAETANADEWESLLLDEVPALPGTGGEIDDPLRS